ncbi:hypothetical protein ABEB36_005379 [Hypothenemus hampei]|uniref:Charged multivesicular body protein 7 n=1 Tax=Hypothenemus hampei TaxID=57062 RepID=A0ABD1EY16_HYPHA
MFNIPEEKQPNCLKDENRLNVLFAPLRSKNVNSKDWDDKITTWKSIIRIYLETNNLFFFSLSSLNDVFIRHGRPPPCLNEVISDMIRKNEVEVLETFLRKSTDTWSGWLTDFVIRRPLNWSYNTVKKSLFSPVNGNYVHLDVVKNKSEQLLIAIPNHFKNKVFNLSELEYKDMPTVENLKLLLHYLERQGKISVKSVPSYKISNDTVTLLVKIGDSPITDIDVAIYTLDHNEKLISKHVENLEDQIEVCIQEAKQHLGKKHKQLAKSCLVKKHQLEKQLQTKANALHNVQNCLEQLRGTHVNSHIWEAYKHALDAFNSTYKETGLNEETVDDTMVRLVEALDINDDIQSALANLPTMDADSTALEQELEDLLRADSTGQDQPPPDDNSGISDDFEKERLQIDLPNIPDSSPDISAQEAT